MDSSSLWQIFPYGKDFTIMLSYLKPTPDDYCDLMWGWGWDPRRSCYSSVPGFLLKDIQMISSGC